MRRFWICHHNTHPLTAIVARGLCDGSISDPRTWCKIWNYSINLQCEPNCFGSTFGFINWSEVRIRLRRSSVFRIHVAFPLRIKRTCKKMSGWAREGTPSHTCTPTLRQLRKQIEPFGVVHWAVIQDSTRLVKSSISSLLNDGGGGYIWCPGDVSPENCSE